MYERLEDVLGHRDQLHCASQTKAPIYDYCIEFSPHSLDALIVVRSLNQVFLVIDCVFVVVCLNETLELPELL